MEILAEDINAVKSSLAYWRRATKGNPPGDTTWEDIEQECYVAILEADPYDPKLGSRGARVNTLVRRVFIDACRYAQSGQCVSYLISSDPPDRRNLSLDGITAVDAEDFLASLSAEDRAVVERVRDHGPAARNSAKRRKESRVLKRVREKLA